MYSVRRFCVRHAAKFERIYLALEELFVRLDPLLAGIGYNRLERPVAFIEGLTKGFLFDCQMCGQCVFSSSVISCSMNCPKTVRNGPCGGVREAGMCEVLPQMRCVWVDGWDGAGRMKNGLARIATVQPPVNRALTGSSSWLRVIREKAHARRTAHSPTPDVSRKTAAAIFRRARKHNPAAVPIVREPDAAMADQAVAESTSVFESEKQKP